MSECYVGEIRMFAGNFAPRGWALCNGQMLSIAENEVLFALIGTTYGGDGQTYFKLPDLSGRIPIHASTDYRLGVAGGTEAVTLAEREMPVHTHVASAVKAPGNVPDPSNAFWAGTVSSNYADFSEGNTVSMNTSAISAVGGSQPHDNMMPTLTVSFIIALEGVFPPQP